MKLAGRDALYHVFSRSVNGEKVFHDKARSVFAKQMHLLAEFCGVEGLTHAVMENYFHFLLKVPKWVEPEREEVLRRAGVLYGEPWEKRLRAEFFAGRPSAEKGGTTTMASLSHCLQPGHRTL